jgi:replicative DNA helicase
LTSFQQEEVYKPDEPELDGIAKIIIAEQRNGSSGRMKVVFVKRSTRFESMAQDGMESSV